MKSTILGSIFGVVIGFMVGLVIGGAMKSLNNIEYESNKASKKSEKPTSEPVGCLVQDSRIKNMMVYIEELEAKGKAHTQGLKDCLEQQKNVTEQNFEAEKQCEKEDLQESPSVDESLDKDKSLETEPAEVVREPEEWDQEVDKTTDVSDLKNQIKTNVYGL